MLQNQSFICHSFVQFKGMSMRAVILAGGKGMRLRPYTVTLPKPLVPVGEEPIMKLLLARLKSQGFRETTICINHMGELITAYFGDGSQYGLKIQYSTEDKPLGTVGPVKKIDNLPEDFLVMNGDILTDLSFRDFFHEHKRNDALMTIAVFKRLMQIEYGVIEHNADNEVTTFVEKPVHPYNVCMGIYAMNKRALDYVPVDSHFGFDDLVQILLEKGEKIKIIEHSGYWLDIGRPEDYEKANEDVTKFITSKKRSQV